MHHESWIKKKSDVKGKKYIREKAESDRGGAFDARETRVVEFHFVEECLKSETNTKVNKLVKNRSDKQNRAIVRATRRALDILSVFEDSYIPYSFLSPSPVRNAP